MSTVQYLARITCDCGATVETPAWAGTYCDGGVQRHDEPEGWRCLDGYDGVEPDPQPLSDRYACPECSAATEAECLARLQAEVVEDGNYLRFSRVLTMREVRVWQAYMATARPCSVTIDGLIA